MTAFQENIKHQLNIQGANEYVNEDNDLVLSKEDNNGLHSWIIFEEDEYAYSYIGNKEGNILEFHTNKQ